MKDILGQALTDYYRQGHAGKLWVHRSNGKKEEMPVEIYFRDMTSMPELEWRALQYCRGRVLDIGAGAGSHALALQRLGLDVTALDISPLGTTLMEQRGVKKVIHQDFFLLKTGAYDTLLLLMNGIGLAGDLDGLSLFFTRARRLLRPGGQLLFDSSDIAYLYSGKPPKGPDYYGIIDYQYEYKRQRSDWFRWLFVDRKTLSAVAAKEGWSTEILLEDRHGQYLARCRPVSS
ncbi:MAG TPA: class I SAM-dependent methyltransferase [Puia sp.]|nr:class I SAM-dependent methyltransferase [Puia sp.]